MTTTTYPSTEPETDTEVSVIKIVKEEVNTVDPANYSSNSVIEEAFAIIGANVDDGLLTRSHGEPDEYVFVTDGYGISVTVNTRLLDQQ